MWEEKLPFGSSLFIHGSPSHLKENLNFFTTSSLTYFPLRICSVPSDLNNKWLLCLCLRSLSVKDMEFCKPSLSGLQSTGVLLKLNVQPVKMLACLEILIWKPHAKLD